LSLHPTLHCAQLERGAKVNRSDNEGTTPLYCAAQRGYTDVVKRLLRAGASPRDAAHVTMDEVGGALIAIAMVANNIVALVSNRLTSWRA
jgi:ankyrin repeat protein